MHFIQDLFLLSLVDNITLVIQEFIFAMFDI